jgi:hypothetical protein
MRYRNGEKVSDEQLLKDGLGHISEGSAFLFEIESDVGKALAFMVDNLIRYGEHILNNRDPRCSEEFYNDIESRKRLSEMSKEEIADLLVDSKVTYDKVPKRIPIIGM